MRLSRGASLALVLLACLLAGCAGKRPSTVPLRTISQPLACGTADTLLVMLPGSYSLPEEFIREGFVRTVRDQQIAADVLLVDAHLGYYNDRSIIDRLQADVIRPARARGYREVWLVGISIGAVGAMLYADEHPGGADGVVLLAPFLGSRLTALDIENAGGLARWPAPERLVNEEIDMRLWRWIKGQTDGTSATPKLPIFQGYGVDDRFVYNNRLMSRSLPATRVFTVEGGHDWLAWNALWKRMVQALPLAREARSGGGCTSAAR
ncbi:MAG: alpha/beta hydrolase [Rhizobacter sp.]